MEISRKSGLSGVMAHRSLGLGAAENSWEAFRRLVSANRCGCHVSVEFDVRCTRDGTLVVFHDQDFEGNEIADLTYGELCALTGFRRPPRLADVLALLQGSGVPVINVELKVMAGVDTALALLAPMRTERILISSFMVEVVEYVADRAPYFETALLLDPKREWRSSTETRLAEFLRIGADVLNVEVSQVTPELSVAVHERGKKLGVYTLNDASTMSDWSNRGLVDWIITDVPSALVPELNVLDLNRISA